MFVIRRADTSNQLVRQGLIALDRDIFGDTAPLIDADEGAWWVAFFEKKEAAFLGLTPVRGQPDTLYLERVGVLPPYRGHGLQTHMTRIAHRYAKGIKAKQIVTDTTLNPASANSLIRCGYKTYLPDKPWAFRNSIYWIKSLQ